MPKGASSINIRAQSDKVMKTAGSGVGVPVLSIQKVVSLLCASVFSAIVWGK